MIFLIEHDRSEGSMVMFNTFVNTGEHRVVEHRGLRRVTLQHSLEFGVFHNPGASVHMESDPVDVKVHEQQPDMGILRYVPQARHHSIPAKFGVREGSVVENFDKAGV